MKNKGTGGVVHRVSAGYNIGVRSACPKLSRTVLPSKMRVLFDQATPVPIRSYLAGHDVRTAAHQGWDRLKHRELVAAAEADGFDVLPGETLFAFHHNRTVFQLTAGEFRRSL
jgi:hypothetical protein